MEKCQLKSLKCLLYFPFFVFVALMILLPHILSVLRIVSPDFRWLCFSNMRTTSLSQEKPYFSHSPNLTHKLSV